MIDVRRLDSYYWVGGPKDEIQALYLLLGLDVKRLTINTLYAFGHLSIAVGVEFDGVVEEINEAYASIQSEPLA